MSSPAAIIVKHHARIAHIIIREDPAENGNALRAREEAGTFVAVLREAALRRRDDLAKRRLNMGMDVGILSQQ